jgi:hypothetical protein
MLGFAKTMANGVGRALIDEPLCLSVQFLASSQSRFAVRLGASSFGRLAIFALSVQRIA